MESRQSPMNISILRSCASLPARERTSPGPSKLFPPALGVFTGGLATTCATAGSVAMLTSGNAKKARLLPRSQAFVPFPLMIFLIESRDLLSDSPREPVRTFARIDETCHLPIRKADGGDFPALIAGNVRRFLVRRNQNFLRPHWQIDGTGNFHGG